MVVVARLGDFCVQRLGRNVQLVTRLQGLGHQQLLVQRSKYRADSFIQVFVSDVFGIILLKSLVAEE